MKLPENGRLMINKLGKSLSGFCPNSVITGCGIRIETVKFLTKREKIPLIERYTCQRRKTAAGNQ